MQLRQAHVEAPTGLLTIFSKSLLVICALIHIFIYEENIQFGISARGLKTSMLK